MRYGRAIAGKTLASASGVALRQPANWPPYVGGGGRRSHQQGSCPLGLAAIFDEISAWANSAVSRFRCDHCPSRCLPQLIRLMEFVARVNSRWTGHDRIRLAIVPRLPDWVRNARRIKFQSQTQAMVFNRRSRGRTDVTRFSWQLRTSSSKRPSHCVAFGVRSLRESRSRGMGHLYRKQP